MKFVKEYNEIGRSYIHIDLEGLAMPKFGFDIEPLLNFTVDTYDVLRAKQPEAKWDMVFKVPEAFLKTLTDEELQQVASTYIYCHYLILQEINKVKPIPETNRVLADQIKNINAEIFMKLEDALSDCIAKLDQSIDLVPKLISYTAQNVPIQQFEGVGERPQDSSEMTFYRNDVVQLTALAIVSKMFAPITGIFIKKFMGLGIDNQYKDIHCAVMFKKLISNRFPELSEKLVRYITRIIKPFTKQQKNPTNLYNAFTADVTQQYIYATMLARKLITVDLYKENANLITFLNACAKETASSQIGGSVNRPAVSYRTAIKDMPSTSGEDGNGSVLEQESSTSDKTADYDSIIQFTVADIRKNFTHEFDLDEEIVQAAEMYYLNTTPPVTISSNNSYLLSIMFGSRLCGAKTIEMLSSKDLALLIPLMQLYFIKHGLFDLVHVVSAINTGGHKATLSGAETQLSAGWCNNYAFANCAKRFPYVVNGMTWCTGLKKMVDDITTISHVYHTAPAIWDILHQENVNGKDYIPAVTLSESICNFILQQNS